jgi:hypothetical protein
MSIRKYLKNKIELKENYESLYHGVKLEVAVKIIESDEMKGSTTQRYWQDGKVRKDDDPDYETSKWMKGWSMTRSFDFAFLWSGIVFEFDKNDLKKDFEIKPISWNYTIGRGYEADHKKEKEEFVISKRTEMSTSDYERKVEEIQDKYYEEYKIDKDINKLRKSDINFIDLLKKPEGKKIKNVNHLIKSIYLSNSIVDSYGKENKDIQKILSHPKFKGILEEEEFTIKKEQENKSKLAIKEKRRIKK